MCHMSHVKCPFLFLYNTTCYTGFTSSSCGGLRPRGETGQNKSFFLMFCLTLGQFWCSVLTSVTFSSALRNFQKNPKNRKKSQKNPKYPKISKIKKKNKKIRENPQKPKKSITKNPKNWKSSQNIKKSWNLKTCKEKSFFSPSKIGKFSLPKKCYSLSFANWAHCSARFRAGALTVAPVSASNQPRGHGLRQQSLRP